MYDSYKGVIVYVRVFEGTVKPGDTMRMMAAGTEFTLVEVGHMGATSLPPAPSCRRARWVTSPPALKNVRDTRVGDTVTPGRRPHPRAPARLPQGHSPWCSAASIPWTAPATQT